MNADQLFDQIMTAARAALPAWVPGAMFDTYISANRASLIARLSRSPRFVALAAGAAQEMREHPWVPPVVARKIAADHLREQPDFYKEAVAQGEERRSRRDAKGCADVCDLKVAGAVACGAKTTIVLAGGGGTRVLPARYCLIRARDLVTSHDPQTFAPNPAYPAGVQERRYDRDLSEQMKVIRIGQDPQLSLLLSTAGGPGDGPSVVTTTGIALGGNGRGMGVKRHYASGGQLYARELEAVAEDFGLRPEDVRRVEDPVVVRVVDAPRDQWPRLVRDLNVPLTQELDVLAQGVALARQLSADAMQLLGLALAEDDQTLAEFLKSPASRRFVEALRRSDVITNQNANRLLESTGLLSEDGRRLVERQLGAAVIPNADLLEAAGPGLRQALARAAPFVLAAAAYGGGWDLRPSWENAVRDYLGARNKDLSVRRWLQQVGLFEPPATEGDEAGRLLLFVLDQLADRPAQLGRLLRQFASDAGLYGGGQKTLLEPLEPIEALRQAVRQAGVAAP